MLQEEPEALLGRPVVDARGAVVGVVRDVGVGERRLPKFLLVGPPGSEGRGLVRVEAREVERRAGAEELRLRVEVPLR